MGGLRPHFSPTYRVPSGYLQALLVRNRRLFFRVCFVASCEMAVAGRTGSNAVGIMPKVHDMWVNSLAALLGALAAIRSAHRRRARVGSINTLSLSTGSSPPLPRSGRRWGVGAPRPLSPRAALSLRCWWGCATGRRGQHRTRHAGRGGAPTRERCAGGCTRGRRWRAPAATGGRCSGAQPWRGDG